MKLLGIDLEIGNPFEEEDGSRRKEENSWLTEIGMVLYDTEMDNQPVDIFSTLVNEGNGVSEEAEEYTGITAEMIEKYGGSPSEIAPKVLLMLKSCDYVVAHNGNKADKPWLKHFLLRHSEPGAFEDWVPPHWIDTLIDIEYPSNCRQKNLTFLNGFHLFANPFPHRAITDVMSMMRILFHYDLDRVIQVSKSPTILLGAVGAVDLITDRKAKSKYFTKGTVECAELDKWKKLVGKAGFRWDGDGEVTGSKRWYKEVKTILIDEGKEEYQFKTVKIG